MGGFDSAWWIAIAVAVVLAMVTAASLSPRAKFWLRVAAAVSLLIGLNGLWGNFHAAYELRSPVVSRPAAQTASESAAQGPPLGEVPRAAANPLLPGPCEVTMSETDISEMAEQFRPAFERVETGKHKLPTVGIYVLRGTITSCHFVDVLQKVLKNLPVVAVRNTEAENLTGPAVWFCVKTAWRDQEGLADKVYLALSHRQDVHFTHDPQCSHDEMDWSFVINDTWPGWMQRSPLIAPPVTFSPSRR